MILISGGIHDPNIACLVSAASRLDVRFHVAYAGINRLEWDFASDSLSFDGRPVRPNAFFQRSNVFGFDPFTNHLRLQWYQSWYHTLQACALHHNWRMFDSANGMKCYCKPLDLMAAKRIGLRVPQTLITDGGVREGNIVKMVMGGKHTEMSKSVEQFSTGVGILQPQLTGQEYRVYVVGNETFVFRMDTQSLDYREKQDVDPVPVPEDTIGICPQIRELSHQKGVLFSASDIKEDADGQPHFLEINTMPCFSEFDRKADGKLSEAMVRWLAGE
jgi:hypothetical protein